MVSDLLASVFITAKSNVSRVSRYFKLFRRPLWAVFNVLQCVLSLLTSEVHVADIRCGPFNLVFNVCRPWYGKWIHQILLAEEDYSSQKKKLVFWRLSRPTTTNSGAMHCEHRNDRTEIQGKKQSKFGQRRLNTMIVAPIRILVRAKQSLGVRKGEAWSRLTPSRSVTVVETSMVA